MNATTRKPTKKKDGRRNNGATKTPNGEDKQLVRGPSTLIEAMRERAASEGRPIASVWRDAAWAYLAGDSEDIRDLLDSARETIR